MLFLVKFISTRTQYFLGIYEIVKVPGELYKNTQAWAPSQDEGIRVSGEGARYECLTAPHSENHCIRHPLQIFFC